MAMIETLFEQYSSNTRMTEYPPGHLCPGERWLGKAECLAFFRDVRDEDKHDSRFRDIGPTTTTHAREGGVSYHTTDHGWDAHYIRFRRCLQADIDFRQMSGYIDLAAFAYMYRGHGRSLKSDVERRERKLNQDDSSEQEVIMTLSEVRTLMGLSSRYVEHSSRVRGCAQPACVAGAACV